MTTTTSSSVMSVSVAGCSSWHALGLRFCSELSALDHRLRQQQHGAAAPWRLQVHRFCAPSSPSPSASIASPSSAISAPSDADSERSGLHLSAEVIAVPFSEASTGGGLEGEGAAAAPAFRFEVIGRNADNKRATEELVHHFNTVKRDKFVQLAGVSIVGTYFLSHGEQAALGEDRDDDLNSQTRAVLFIAYAPKKPDHQQAWMQPSSSSSSSSSSSGALDSPLRAIRLLSFNIWVGGGTSVQACLAVIRASHAQIICLQEATPLTMELFANDLGIDTCVPSHGLLTTVAIEGMEVVNANTVVFRLPAAASLLCASNTRAIRVSTVHLPAYPYGPHELIQHGPAVAMAAEAATQLPELHRLLVENGVEAPALEDSLHFAAGRLHGGSMPRPASVCSFTNGLSPVSEDTGAFPVGVSPGSSDCSSPTSSLSSPLYRFAQTPTVGAASGTFADVAAMLAGAGQQQQQQQQQQKPQAESQLEIFCGDFNAPSHLDESWLGTKLPAMEDAAADADAVPSPRYARLSWATSRMMQAAGFTDTFRLCNLPPAHGASSAPRDPRDAYCTWSPMPGRERLGCYDRIDYIYCRKTDERGCFVAPMDVVAACTNIDTVGDDRMAAWPSDHRAVLATLLL